MTESTHFAIFSIRGMQSAPGTIIYLILETATMEQKKKYQPSKDDPAKMPKKGKKVNPAEDPNRADEPNPATDPQESMQGPVSSFIQGIKHRAEHNDEKEEEEHKYKQSHSGGDFINK